MTDFTRKEAAAYLDMSASLLDKILYTERILRPSYYVGRTPIFTRESLDELQEQRALPKRDEWGHELCNASEVSRILGISRQAVYERIKSGSLVPDVIDEKGRRWFRKDHCYTLAKTTVIPL